MRESILGPARPIRRAVLAVCALLASLATPGPAAAKPLVQPAVSEAEKLKAVKTQGEKAQRINETRQRLWDRNMMSVSDWVCNGC